MKSWIKKFKFNSRDINSTLNEIFQSRKSFIMERVELYLGRPISESDAKRALKNEFNERFKKEGYTKHNKKNVVDIIDKMENSIIFTTSTERDFANLKASLIETKDWEIFRKLNHHQKLDPNNLVKLKPPAGSGLKGSWVYNHRIKIDLIYEEDGSYRYEVYKNIK